MPAWLSEFSIQLGVDPANARRPLKIGDYPNGSEQQHDQKKFTHHR
jgi:hypothetical protein